MNGLRQMAASGAFYLLLAYTMVMTVPSSFQATYPSPDAAWGYDLNYFLHSRFQFGQDLSFTYGPLGFLNNPLHIGNDIQIAVAVHAVFWLALGAQLIPIWRSGKKAAALTFCLALVLGHRLYYDYWDYDLLALGIITVFKLIRTSPTYLDIALLPCLMAVSFLLKFTAFSTICLMVFVYAMHLVFERRFVRWIMVWLGVCLISCPVAYLVYNPSIVHLFEYAKAASQIASGFTTAMSTQSSVRDDRLAVFLCLILALNTAIGLWQRRLLWSESLLIVLVTWVVFRHGFVRGDFWHTAMFFDFSVVIFACLFMGTRAYERIWPQVILTASFCLFSFVAISGSAERYPAIGSVNWWPPQCFSEMKRLWHWGELVQSLDHDADPVFAALPGMAFRPLIEGKRVLVFPYSTPYVAKINFEMFPIYALQDYAAYTAYLDKRGAQNLLTANPPVEQVLMEWGDIDGRNQMLDTPAMSLALLSAFTFQSDAPKALLLKHRELSLPIHLDVISRETYQADGWVNVPERDELVAMSIRLKQNWKGQLVTALYDQAAIYMELQTQAGGVVRYRVPPQTLRNPGLINYVPNSLDELEKLFGAEPLHGKIARIRLTGPGLRRVASDGYLFFAVNNAGLKVLN